MLMLPMLNACATPATPAIADSACLVFKPIRYAIPPVQADGTRNMAVDPANAHDTVGTVKDVQDHNVRYAATCPRRSER